ncbi:hypothetical protein BASA62_000311 [Batrachochytrium salamandrivorans]|nr:hypothetical protein BASA62_000311 [Batrachochytrium salamandrivorans]
MINDIRVANHKALSMLRMAKSLTSHRPLVQISIFPKRACSICSQSTVDFERASDTASTQLGIRYSKFDTHIRGHPGHYFAKKASYRAIPLPRRDATEGFAVVTKPEFKRSSPNGWTDGKATEGNNIITKTPRGNTTPSIRKGVFNSKFDITRSPGTVANVAAAAVNLFYLTNVMHDISYQYGFTESAGNFQKDNFNKGGQGQVTLSLLLFLTLPMLMVPNFSPP